MKRIVFLLCIVSMIFALAACSIAPSVPEAQSSPAQQPTHEPSAPEAPSETPTPDVQTDPPEPTDPPGPTPLVYPSDFMPETPVNLIFIHHSTGKNWLEDGLNEMLNQSNYHVADTHYGWHEIGDRTDTVDWPDWFNDDIMPTVYSELTPMTATNTFGPAPGENEIVMFKSCYPNSEVGDSFDDEKAIYNSLLPYFAAHPDKMFIFLVPPPKQKISNPVVTRELSLWLVDETGWRHGYTAGNLFVFDFYNILTAQDNHHYFDGTNEVHTVADPSNTLFYDSGGDNHPNREGNTKAAGQFVPLLNYWYWQFSNR